MSEFKDLFYEAGLSNNSSKRMQEPQSGNGRQKNIFSDMFESVFGKNTSATTSYPTTRAGPRNESMQTSDYDTYSKKLFAKEGGMRYDLFTGEKTPSKPLDRLTIGEVKALQKGRKDTAAGAYQFTLATIEDLQKETGLKDTDVFSPANQYRMFETFTRGNESYARERLGISKLSDAQRYSMHFLGRFGGADFLKKLGENPDASFASLFPKAYSRNKALFSNIGGQRATLRDTFYELSKRMK